MTTNTTNKQQVKQLLAYPLEIILKEKFIQNLIFKKAETLFPTNSTLIPRGDFSKTSKVLGLGKALSEILIFSCKF